ncbi:hypothetical protein Pcinc_026400 [Petrolisthes cinctipes]|uniref:Uncharacterized protein n=1 Tax=Petrolisthes cinctipes TaxID=88211 RepID=A0AAE1KCB8_PETCI|nr:hypothetical protein Pcinc_026400 [Petrolisthes cinctipes]
MQDDTVCFWCCQQLLNVYNFNLRLFRPATELWVFQMMSYTSGFRNLPLIMVPYSHNPKFLSLLTTKTTVPITSCFTSIKDVGTHGNAANTMLLLVRYECDSSQTSPRQNLIQLCTEHTPTSPLTPYATRLYSDSDLKFLPELERRPILEV